MRTNIDIDDDLMTAALAAGPYRTKREAVEAGLKLLQRQAAARKLLELEGKVAWGWGDEERLLNEPNWQQPEPATVRARPAQPSKAKPAKLQRTKPARRAAVARKVET
ncbi:type II toxin-antitoxin system VapB family antitoxin [Pelomonas aquatica]|uniref:Type II toxin-antitoxin system VapB family antitoxin n=1 Tax=Pelomonas aquatica TaxID=431058 RepID=A0A9X4LG06_9BURK|nr:type II toxin-antitoxin system VapB family antitoxin [Pelomonas aquatica]MCY4755179.1 type II toxin-antitoxin system VapB family antitoxin [Pelomonas aquatica]MDG0862488.1 type II toxin-antitoxin system VapB family antitoxin [Pelomonas aquatica]